MIEGVAAPRSAEADRVDVRLYKGAVFLYYYEHASDRDLLIGDPDRIALPPDPPEGISHQSWSLGLMHGILDDLEEEGFTIHRWPDCYPGGRAWRGEPWPVRRGGAVNRRRRELESDIRSGRIPPSPDHYLLGFDLAYDL